MWVHIGLPRWSSLGNADAHVAVWGEAFSITGWSPGGRISRGQLCTSLPSSSSQMLFCKEKPEKKILEGPPPPLQNLALSALWALFVSAWEKSLL